MKKILFLTSAAIIGCATTTSTKLTNKKHVFPPISADTPVYLLDETELVPYMSDIIGSVKIGETGFSTECTYEKAVEKIKNAARKAGANIIRIIEVEEPDGFTSDCYRMRGALYRNLDEANLVKVNDFRKQMNRSLLAEGSDYAVVYFYRPRNTYGANVTYDIKTAGDSVIGEIKDGVKFAYKTKKFGIHSFFGKREVKSQIEINIEKGQEYYVRCAITTGIITGRPEISIVENFQGRSEYNKTD